MLMSHFHCAFESLRESWDVSLLVFESVKSQLITKRLSVFSSRGLHPLINLPRG